MASTKNKKNVNENLKDGKTHTTGSVKSVQAELSQVEGLEQTAIRCGYQVGLREDGSFVFDLVGEGNGAVELMGLHKYASVQIDNLVMPSVQHSNFALLQNLKVIFNQLETLLGKQNSQSDG